MRLSAGGGGSPRERYRSSPTTASATRSSADATPSASDSSLVSSADDDAATASTALERSISATLAPRALAAALATAGRPAPDSIAPERASSVASSGPFAGDFRLAGFELTPEC